MKEIITTKGNIILVDDDDFEELSKHKWGEIGNTRIYAARGTRKNGVYSKILMHRVIMKPKKNQMVDHINGNTKDNRKQNLRITDRVGNIRNSKLRSDSKCSFKGVSRRISKNNTIRYIARIQLSKNKRLFLGYFETEEAAVKAYRDAAIKYFGEFAKY